MVDRTFPAQHSSECPRRIQECNLLFVREGMGHHHGWRVCVCVCLCVDACVFGRARVRTCGSRAHVRVRVHECVCACVWSNA